MVAVDNKELFISALKPLTALGYRFIVNGGRKERPNAKFTAQELKIIIKEKDKTFEENIKMFEAVNK